MKIVLPKKKNWSQWRALPLTLLLSMTATGVVPSQSYLSSLIIPSAHAAVDNLPSDSFDDYDEEKYGAQYNESVARLEESRQALRAADASLTAARSDEFRVRQRLDQIVISIQSAQADDQNLSRQIDAGTQASIQIGEQIKSMNASLNQINAELNQLRPVLQQLQADQAAAQKEYDASTQQLNTITTIYNNSKATYDQKKAAADANRSQISATQTGINNKQAEFVTLTERRQNLTARVGQLRAEKQDINNDLQIKAQVKTVLEGRIAAVNAEIAALEAQKSQPGADLPGIEAQISAKRFDLQLMQQQRDSLIQQMRDPQARLAAIDAETAASEAAINTATARLAVLQPEIENDKNRLVQLTAAQPELDNAANWEKSNLDTTAIALERQKGVQALTASRLNDAKTAADRVAGRVNELVQGDANLRAQLGRAGQDLERVNHDVADMRQRQVALRQQIGGMMRDRDIASNQLARAEAETRRRMTDRDLAANGVQAADQERLRRGQRLEQVQNNRKDARQKIQAIATAEATQDGSQEGREFGEADGRRDGSKNGSDKGKADGTREGKARDYNLGYASGTERGKANGTSDAKAKAEVDGRKTGTEQGTRDGLAVAYAKGKADGLEHGKANGTDRNAYAQGRTRGEAKGLEEARRDAKYREVEGFNDKEKEYRSAPLEEVTIGQFPAASGFNGLQAAGASQGDGRYYRPRPKQYPHPVIKAYYMEAYDNVYRGALESTYASVYRSSYDSSYRDSYDKARRDALSLEYVEDRTRGDQEAYRKFYDETYRNVYPVEYEARRSYYYGTSFEVSAKDQATIQKGWNDGNAIGSDDKGYRDGREASYNTNLPKEKDLAYGRGQAAANQKYTENAVLDVVSSDVRDSDDDSIYRPGETLSVELVIKNYGMKPKSGLISRLQLQGAAGSGSPETAIANIPAKSLVRIRGIGVTQVNPSAKENSGGSIAFQVLNTDRAQLHMKVTNFTAMYPVAIENVDFGGVLVPGVATNVGLTLKNRSTKPQNLLVALNLDPSKVDAQALQNGLGTLNPGQSVKTTFTLTGKPEAKFEAAPIQVTVTDGGRVFAAPLTLDSAIIRKHEATPGSIGMILSGDLSKGSGKFLHEMAKMDTWDMRVDGAIKEDRVLNDYVSKIVHMQANEYLTLDRATIASLKSYLSKGGALVVWGTELESNRLIESFGDVLGVSESAPISTANALTGVNMLRQHSLEVLGERSGLALTAANLKTSPIFMSGADVIGVATHTGEFTDKIGRVFLIGTDAKNLSKEKILSMHDRIANIRLPFAQKLSLAKDDIRYLPLVLDEIIEEALSDDVRTDIAWHGDSRKSTKMYQAIMLLTTKVKTRDDFYKAYADVWSAAVEKMVTGDRSAVVYNMQWTRSGTFANSWGQSFCQKYFDRRKHNSAMCDGIR